MEFKKSKRMSLSSSLTSNFLLIGSNILRLFPYWIENIIMRIKVFCDNCKKWVDFPTLLEFTEWVDDENRQINECPFGCE